jgi:hypothetical protein
MDRRLKGIVDEIRSVRTNPDDMVAGTLMLQIELVRSGDRYSEDDLFEALRELGADELEMASWFERYASWV